MTLHLMSHALCPYVQRAVIALTERQASFDRTTIDLANKPDWFLALSPLSQTPVLTVDGQPIFESSAILEYLEDTQPSPLHPTDPLTRAQHRGWIEVSSAILNDIAGFYSAKDAEVFATKTAALAQKFARVDATLDDGPFFAGEAFSLVDAAFAPVFRYFDVIDQIDAFGIFEPLDKLQAWRATLSSRPSVRAAVSSNYPSELRAFLLRRQSFLSTLMAKAA